MAITVTTTSKPVSWDKFKEWYNLQQSVDLPSDKLRYKDTFCKASTWVLISSYKRNMDYTHHLSMVQVVYFYMNRIFLEKKEDPITVNVQNPLPADWKWNSHPPKNEFRTSKFGTHRLNCRWSCDDDVDDSYLRTLDDLYECDCKFVFYLDPHTYIEEEIKEMLGEEQSISTVAATTIPKPIAWDTFVKWYDLQLSGNFSSKTKIHYRNLFSLANNWACIKDKQIDTKYTDHLSVVQMAYFYINRGFWEEEKPMTVNMNNPLPTEWKWGFHSLEKEGRISRFGYHSLYCRWGNDDANANYWREIDGHYPCDCKLNLMYKDPHTYVKQDIKETLYKLENKELEQAKNNKFYSSDAATYIASLKLDKK